MSGRTDLRRVFDSEAGHPLRGFRPTRASSASCDVFFVSTDVLSVIVGTKSVGVDAFFVTHHVLNVSIEEKSVDGGLGRPLRQPEKRRR